MNARNRKLLEDVKGEGAVFPQYLEFKNVIVNDINTELCVCVLFVFVSLFFFL